MYYTDNYLVTILIFTILLHFYTGKEIYKAKSILRKKTFFIIGAVGSLGILGFFKYSDFAISQFNIFGNSIDLNPGIPLLELALPIGISFYTFQSLSYIIDIYRGELKPSKTLKEYAFFVAFFPPLIAGPILRASNFLPQLREKFNESDTSQKLKLFVIKNQNLKFGITLMSLGFFKKLFFADNIGPLVNNIFSNPIGMESFSIMLGALAFGVQIYCDFSGYSDIAIGAAALLGLKIPLNFNKPFFATSPSDFWSRWHISLSTWVRDYLYFPLSFRIAFRKSGILVIREFLTFGTYLFIFVLQIISKESIDVFPQTPQLEFVKKFLLKCLISRFSPLFKVALILFFKSNFPTFSPKNSTFSTSEIF